MVSELFMEFDYSQLKCMALMLVSIGEPQKGVCVLDTLKKINNYMKVHFMRVLSKSET